METCLLFSFILLPCSTVRKVTQLAILRNLLESCGVCQLPFSHSRANVRGRMELQTGNVKPLQEFTAGDGSARLPESTFPPWHPPPPQKKGNFRVGLAWKIASRVEVLAEDWNCTIELRNCCGNANRFLDSF